MLMSPGVNLPFTPQLSYWLGGIGTYDLEETLGVALAIYDPNDASDREIVIRKFILGGFFGYTYRHKFLMVKILEDALSSPCFDFSKLFEDDYDSNTCVAWDETMVDDPRGFFEDIYRFAVEQWHEELKKARAENQSSW
ncbi:MULTISPECIES: hypothetical protein [unclassified Pseudomonas]|uniref:hypothetical protein n=1 Tax=unclassified Pseudomonas TaxID=196821 RepID=UPI000A1F29F4|nr:MULTISPECIES: hypothetical protein [unclassified Pseudomonas]